jgi:hypothetical protein
MSGAIKTFAFSTALRSVLELKLPPRVQSRPSSSRATCAKTSNEAADKGTRCAIPAFMRGDGTHCLYEVDLLPCGAQDFAHPRGGEFQRPGCDTFLTKLRECIASTSR